MLVCNLVDTETPSYLVRVCNECNQISPDDVEFCIFCGSSNFSSKTVKRNLKLRNMLKRIILLLLSLAVLGIGFLYYWLFLMPRIFPNTIDISIIENISLDSRMDKLPLLPKMELHRFSQDEDHLKLSGTKNKQGVTLSISLYDTEEDALKGYQLDKEYTDKMFSAFARVENSIVQLDENRSKFDQYYVTSIVQARDEVTNLPSYYVSEIGFIKKNIVVVVSHCSSARNVTEQQEALLKELETAISNPSLTR